MHSSFYKTKQIALQSLIEAGCKYVYCIFFFTVNNEPPPKKKQRKYQNYSFHISNKVSTIFTFLSCSSFFNFWKDKTVFTILSKNLIQLPCIKRNEQTLVCYCIIRCNYFLLFVFGLRTETCLYKSQSWSGCFPCILRVQIEQHLIYHNEHGGGVLKLSVYSLIEVYN